MSALRNTRSQEMKDTLKMYMKTKDRKTGCPVGGAPFRSMHGQPSGNPPSWKFAWHATQRVFKKCGVLSRYV
jgi:hypothetical protein